MVRVAAIGMTESQWRGAGEGGGGGSDSKKRRLGSSGIPMQVDEEAVNSGGMGRGSGVPADLDAHLASISTGIGGQKLLRTLTKIKDKGQQPGGYGALASSVLSAVRPLLSDPPAGGANSHTLELAIAILEILACKSVGGECIDSTVQEMVEVASAPGTLPRVLQRCLLCLERIGVAHPSLHRPGLPAVLTLMLREAPPCCRRVALRVLAQPGVVPGEEAAKVLLNFTKDPDHSVRSSALNTLCRCLPADLAMYREVVKSLSDDYGCVRVAALGLAARIGAANADIMLHKGHPAAPRGLDADVRMCDDAFMQACGLVFDADVAVRAKACAILGEIPGVSPQYLVQTLSKRLLTYNQLEDVQQSAAEAEGDFQIVSGSSLLSADAAGAFVVGLEDEFWEVRVAAIGSIARLALGSRVFRDKAGDVLVDMLSDEILGVRMAAIEALDGLRKHIELSEEHLQVVLALLDDVSEPLRRSVHSLLGGIPLTTPTALHMTVEALNTNVRRHNTDTPHVYRCLARLGVHLSSLAEEVTPRLLASGVYSTTEADMDDPTYVGILILTLSAASVNPHVLSLVPSHCLRHWRCLREREPLITPRIEVLALGGHLLEYADVASGGCDGAFVDKQREAFMASSHLLLGEAAHLASGGRPREVAHMIDAGLELLGKVVSWRGGEKRGEATLMQLHMRVLRAVCDVQMACGEGRELSAGCRAPLDVCRDLAALALECVHGFSAPPTDNKKPGARPMGDAASPHGGTAAKELLCFALTAAALLAGGPSEDGRTVRCQTDAHAAACLSARWDALAALLGECDAGCLHHSLELLRGHDRGISALKQAVKGFWLVPPGRQESGVRRQARIISPPQADDQSHAEEVDWRLPHRLPLEVSVEACGDEGRVAVTLTAGGGGKKVLQITVADVIEVDSAAGGRLVRGWVLLEFDQAWQRPGFVYLDPVWVPKCSPGERDAVRALGGDLWVRLGPTRRILIHPVAK